jgi:hypothetical protein
MGLRVSGPRAERRLWHRTESEVSRPAVDAESSICQRYNAELKDGSIKYAPEIWSWTWSRGDDVGTHDRRTPLCR